jgi:hypothetical protein
LAGLCFKWDLTFASALAKIFPVLWTGSRLGWPSWNGDTMQSRLFTTVFDNPEGDNAKTFARHLRETLQLGEERCRMCVDALPQLSNARTPTQEREFVSDLASKSGITRSTLAHALSVIKFLSDSLVVEGIPDNDSDLWASDLQELGWVDDELRLAFDSLLERLTSARSDLQFRKHERRATGGVLPCFTSLGYTVEVRPIREKIFRWGERVEEYEPKILGTVLVTSIHIGVDEGPTEGLYFQTDEEDIDNIIDSLRAAKKEMAALRKFLRVDSTGTINRND